MGHLEILGAIVPAAIQNESAHGSGLLWIIFEISHHSNKCIFIWILTSIYLYISTAQRAYISWHRVNDNILVFEMCMSPLVQ